MAYTFQGRRVLVTGASSGIGAVTAKEFARAGAIVAIVSEKDSDLRRVASEINADGGEAHLFVVDLSVTEQRDTLLRRIEAVVGPIDILVNNAGVGLGASLMETRLSELRFLFEVNFFALADLSQQALCSMSDRRAGHIINISSGSGRLGLPGVGAYSATKGAVHAYTQALRAEARQFNVNVSEVLPISVKTSFFDNVKGQRYQPRGLTQTPEIVAHSILRAASHHTPPPEILPFRLLQLAFVVDALWPGFMARVQARNYSGKGGVGSSRP